MVGKDDRTVGPECKEVEICPQEIGFALPVAFLLIRRRGTVDPFKEHIGLAQGHIGLLPDLGL